MTLLGPPERHLHTAADLERMRRLAERLDDRDLDVVTTARPPGAPAWLLELDEDRGHR